MIRIFGAQILKISVFPKTKCEIHRNIWTSSCIRYSKFTAQEVADKKRQDKEMRWKKFYHYPNMKYHAIITRLKIYPALATVFFTPVCLLLEAQQIIPSFTFLSCLTCGENSLIHFYQTFGANCHSTCNRYIHLLYFQGLMGTLTLSTYSALLADTIGVIYICKENKNLQIAYIDFVGRQQFVETTVDEMRKCEKGSVKFGLYRTIKVNDGNEKKVLTMPWSSVDIYDNKLFRKLFGK